MTAPVESAELRITATLLIAQADADEKLGIQPKDTQFYRNAATLITTAANLIDAQQRALEAAQQYQVGTEVTDAIERALTST